MWVRLFAVLEIKMETLRLFIKSLNKNKPIIC